MSNDFLNNYKKKSEEQLAQHGESASQGSASPQNNTNANANNNTQGQTSQQQTNVQGTAPYTQRPLSASQVQPANSGTVQQNSVQNTAPQEQNAQQSTAKSNAQKSQIANNINAAVNGTQNSVQAGVKNAPQTNNQSSAQNSTQPNVQSTRSALQESGQNSAQPNMQNKPQESSPNNAFLNTISQTSMSFEQKSGFAPVANTMQNTNTSNASNSTTRRRQNKLPLPYIIVGAIVLVLIVVLIIFLTRGTALPAMEGWSQSDVNLWANENEVLIQTEEVYSDEIPAGQIISQSPAEGETLENGEFVKIVVSLGPDLTVTVPVPDIMNMTMNEVETWAEENHMKTVRITTEASETIPSGQAIRFYVNDNTVLSDEIRRDTPFYVVFSKGAGEGEDVKVPNFLTMSLQEVNNFGAENKITIELIEEFSDTVVKGSIIRQSIKADEIVHSGDTIKIYVSKGKDIIVPNFAQYDKDEATIKATQIGVTVYITEKYVMGYEEGMLVSQSIAAGSHYDDEQVIELVYSLGDKVVVQSFVGKTEVDVRNWVTPLNEQGASIKVSTTYTSSDKVAGTVLSQDKIDYTIAVTDTINLVVSNGGIVYMPNFVSPQGTADIDVITREKAIDMCAQLQLVPIFVEASGEGRVVGEIAAQNIAQGTELEQGSNITLTYYTKAKSTFTVPNFVDKTKAEIVGSIYETQFTILYDDPNNVGSAGVITAQSVAVNTTAPQGTVITLTIGSSASAPSSSSSVAPPSSSSSSVAPTP